MKRLVLITAAASLGISGVAYASVAGAAPAPASASKIDWQKCPEDIGYLANAECAQLPVPLDHRKPNGKKISVAVSRVKHTDTKDYKGVLIGNPGGPGGSGLYLSAGLAAWLPPAVAAKYDIIGFDPRGVGLSRPALSCDLSYTTPVRPDYVPRTKAEEQRWVKRAAKYAKACGSKFGWLLPHMRTTDAARDIDDIRAALGVKKISYYGFSYGTYLGATYGTMFPHRVRRMVLDGNVKPSEIWYDSQISQDLAFERNFGLYADWIAKYDSVYHLGTSRKVVEANYYKIRAQVKKSPIAGEVGPDELDDTVLSAGYNTGWYEPIADALSQYKTQGKGDLLNDLYDPPTEDGLAVYNAVQAADAPWPRDWKVWHKDAVKTNKKAPFMTWNNVWFNAPAAFWPIKGGPKYRVGTSKMPSALLVQATLDGATPYPGGLEMHKLFPASRLVVEVGGKTHANTLNGNTCLDDRVAAYLDTGALPAQKSGPDVTCGALADPDPTAASMRSKAGASELDQLKLNIGRP